MGEAARELGIIILAAGASQRMGSPKQLLQFRGHSLLRHALEEATLSGATQTALILGANAELMKSEIPRSGVMLLENHDWQRGVGSSIRIGVNYFAGQTTVSAVLIMNCDQPLVSRQFINHLIRTWTIKHPTIVAAEFKGIQSLPAIFDRVVFGELLRLPHSAGPKEIILRYHNELIGVEFEQAGFDVDSPSDYERLVRAHGG